MLTGGYEQTQTQTTDYRLQTNLHTLYTHYRQQTDTQAKS